MAVAGVECAPTAADCHNALAMLVREGETLAALLKRLDKAIARYHDTDEIVDEINPTGD